MLAICLKKRSTALSDTAAGFHQIISIIWLAPSKRHEYMLKRRAKEMMRRVRAQTGSEATSVVRKVRNSWFVYP